MRQTRIVLSFLIALAFLFTAAVNVAQAQDDPPLDSETITWQGQQHETSMLVELLSHDGPTWTYRVTKLYGHDLSHWVLVFGACESRVVSSSPAGAEIGRDGSTGYSGIKWNSEGGTFSFTLDANYPMAAEELTVVVKASNNYATGTIMGPDCSQPPVEPKGSIKAVKFHDENENGAWDEGEEYLSGWEMTVKQGDAVVTSGDTGDDGSVTFEDLTIGDYEVCETEQDGWTASTDVCQPATVTDGGVAVVTFGNFETPPPPPTRGSIKAVKFHDENENGVWDDGESPLSGWAMTVYADDADRAPQYTGDDGSTVFENLPAGGYEVCETLQEGWTNSTVLCQDVTVVAGEQSLVVFGNYVTPPPPPAKGSIKAIKFHDENMNGVWDDGELPLSGWEMTVYRSDADRAPMYTGDDGVALFENLPLGDYEVCETLQDGWTASTDVCQPATVTDGGVTVVTFGNYETPPPPPTKGSIKAVKFHDLNEDGAWNEGEPYLSGWEMTVYRSDADRAPQYTGDDGATVFANLPAGDYEVCETLQEGWTNSTALCQAVTVVAGEQSVVVFGNFKAKPPKPGNIVVQKFTFPEGSSQVFHFTASFDADGFTLSDGQSHDSGPLAPGVYSVAEVAVQGWENVSAKCSDGSPASAIDLSAGETVTCVFKNVKKKVLDPDASILIKKATNAQDADVAPGPPIKVGAKVTWLYKVMNTGKKMLVNITVTDDKEGFICTIASLAPGQHTTCKKQGVAMAGQYANVGTVVGYTQAGAEVSDTDPSHYYGGEVKMSGLGVDLTDPALFMPDVRR